MTGLVLINGRAAVFVGCAGQAVAFPDVCLCPPGPPAGPVPVPLPNTVVAADLAGCAKTVTIDGQPMAHQKSYFAKSTGNEVSRSTGGGVVSHATQGMAYFQSGSEDVLVEGQPAVRHGDLLTCNHLSRMPPNTPPTPWMSTMAGPEPLPGSVRKTLSEGKDFIRVRFVDELGEPLGKGHYQIKTPAGREVKGRILHQGRVTLCWLASGSCEIVLPDADARAAEVGQRKPAKTSGEQKAYVPGSPLRLATGQEYVVVVPYTKSLWVDLPVRVDRPDARDDQFVLESKDGSFRQKRTIADDRINGDHGLTLEFYGLEPGKSYTLKHHMGEGQPVRTMFEDLPYEEIFPKDRPKLRQIEDADDFGLEDASEPWVRHETIPPEEDGLDLELHEWPPQGDTHG
jgi:uncharacterized Zn-binding protein involved in type VI secretion